MTRVVLSPFEVLGRAPQNNDNDTVPGTLYMYVPGTANSLMFIFTAGVIDCRMINEWMRPKHFFDFVRNWEAITVSKKPKWESEMGERNKSSFKATPNNRSSFRGIVKFLTIVIS